MKEKGISNRIGTILTTIVVICAVSALFFHPHYACSAGSDHLKLYKSDILAKLPPGTFLENLVWDREGNLYITNNTANTILKYSYANNSLSDFAKISAQPAGIAIDSDGTIYVGGVQKPFGSPGFMESNAIFKIDKQGTSSLFIEAPKARYLNGWVFVKPGIFLICDSYGGVVWQLDVKRATMTEWLRNDLLATKNMIPGANGIKLYKHFVFVSNSSQGKLLKITMDKNGKPVRTEIYKDNVNLDDFSIAEGGNIYATTHPENVIYLIKEKGKPEIIAAGEEDGVRGNTAAVFGENRSDTEWLYVVGDGGLWEAQALSNGKTIDQTKLRPAALTKIYVGERGHFKGK
jgi:hypothetical protein